MKPTSFTHKISICILAGLTVGATFLRLGKRFLTFVVPLNIVFIIAILFLLVATSYSAFWQQRDKNKTIDNEATKEFWTGVMRYSVAIDLSTFGFQKSFTYNF
jgi:thiamine transporter ThiT